MSNSNGTSSEATSEGKTPASVSQNGKAAPSKRQVEILQLLASGKTQREVAVGLGISINTVNKHLGELYYRLGAVNVAQAVARGISLGLVVP